MGKKQTGLYNATVFNKGNGENNAQGWSNDSPVKIASWNTVPGVSTIYP
jgi:hypothetical protein